MCKVGDKWNSRVGGQADGQLTITSIVSPGNFIGDHSGDTVHIKCNDVTISYPRPGHGSYRGEFVGLDIQGRHSRTTVAKRKKGAPPDDEEWVGTHT